MNTVVLCLFMYSKVAMCVGEDGDRSGSHGNYSAIQVWRRRWFVLFKNELRYYHQRQVSAVAYCWQHIMSGLVKSTREYIAWS